MCFQGLARHSRRVRRRFVLGSREISLAPALHRASTDTLIDTPNTGQNTQCLFIMDTVLSVIVKSFIIKEDLLDPNVVRCLG